MGQEVKRAFFTLFIVENRQTMQTDTVFIPDFELIRQIGKGSYGEVWLARSVTGIYRAIKMVHRDRFENARPFEREFAGMKRFESISRSQENLVDILHVGRQDERGCFYYVMELADSAGGHALESTESGRAAWVESYLPNTLREVLGRRRRLPVEECLPVSVGLTRAIAHLHANGLIHRDIKPSNVIFVNGVPKLADIGLVSGVEESRSFVGTEGFVPPEGPGTPSADVFSLGKLLYEMSTGRDRLEFPKLPEELEMIADREALFEFNEVVLKACSPKAIQRYSSAPALLDDLLLLQAGRSVKNLRRLEKKLALARRFGALLIALALATGLVWNQARQTQRRAAEQWARVFVANGRQLLGEDDLLGALPWFAAALLLDDRDPEHAALHRLRLASVLRQSPQVVHLVAHSEPAARFAVISAAGDQFALNENDTVVRVWDTATDKPLTQPLCHSVQVLNAAFSPDARRLVTCCADGTAHLWEVPGGRPVGSPMRHTAAITQMAFNGDGRLLATASLDHTVRIWDGQNATAAGPALQHEEPVQGISFSQDGHRLVSATQSGRVRVWNVGDGGLIGAGIRCDGGTVHATLSPDGSRVVTGSADSTVRLWNADTGEPISPPFNHRSAIIACVFSASGRNFLTFSREAARVWDSETGKPVTDWMTHAADISHACFSPNGNRVLTSSDDGTARVWDAASGAPLGSPMKHADVIFFGMFLSSHRVLTVSRDWTARTWELPGETNDRNSIQHEAAVSLARFSGDGKRLATASDDDTARVWEATALTPATGPLLHSSKVLNLSFSPDGQRLLTTCADRTAWIWGVNSGRLEHILHPPEGIRCGAVFSGDGRFILTGDKDGIARIWETETGKPVRSLAHGGGIRAVAWSPDARKVVTCGEDSACVWDAGTGRVKQTFQHRRLVWRAGFSLDGRKLLTSDEQTTGWWDIETGALASPRFRGDSGVASAVFSDDQRRVFTISANDTGRVWDTLTGKPLTLPFKSSGPILHAEFSRDGKLLIVACGDHTAQVWAAETGEPITPLLRHGGAVRFAAFSPDGRQMVTAGDDDRANLWTLPAEIPSDSSLVEQVQFLAAHRVSRDGLLEPMSLSELKATWKSMQANPSVDRLPTR